MESLRNFLLQIHISEQVYNKLTDLLGDINSPILVSKIFTDLVQTKEPVGKVR